MIEIIALRGIGEVKPGDDLSALIAQALYDNDLKTEAGDILVITSKIVSKAENQFVKLDSVAPSKAALELAAQTGKDARLAELVLSESSSILRVARNLIIARHRLGLVLANAGIDASNVGRRDHVLLLPSDPDASASDIRSGLAARGHNLAVIISDSLGRAWRLGVVNVAIGAAGIAALVDRRGELDRDGRVLEVTEVAVADMIAAAAGLVCGEAAESVPVALLRGCQLPAGERTARSLVRPIEQDLFT